ncbi:hypothetical protein CRV08_09800 [Halarcobacter ebronensis]|uniref:Secreted protein n=1 Tax=Halarcobacter ebronensis TaxID=1462615 RepID=A0A4Q0YDL6_9BACT|nr:hypothetical protein [Halarcobacter ebronensis]RXJ67654.1 hypothetical protein CRV08_09800 [Halarcobacter ebronensis]
MKKIFIGLALLASSMFAHSAIMSCFDNGDGTVTCEGGFSDGSSASGVNFYLLQNDKKVFEAKISEDSEISFKKPAGTYSAVFDAGEGHQVFVSGSDIAE